MLWVTNYAAPYRLPVWDALSSWDRDFNVWVLGDNELNRLWSGSSAARGYIKLLRVGEFHIAGTTLFYLRGMSPLARELRRSGGVIIGGWEHPAYWQVCALGILMRVPRVLFYESTSDTHAFSSGPVAIIRRTFMKYGVQAALVPGPAAARAVLTHGVSAENVVQGFNSIDEEAVLRAVADSQRGESPVLRLCFVGQLVPRKNVLALLEAFFEADIDAAHLDIVGQGPEEAAVKEYLASHQTVSNRSVRLHGPLPADSALRVMVSSDALVLPSKEEVWGLVVNEALSAGLRVLVGANCGVYPSVKHMRGVHACETHPQSIKEGLERLSETRGGWIEAPEILREGTPLALAGQAVVAVERAARMRTRPWAKKVRAPWSKRES